MSEEKTTRLGTCRHCHQQRYVECVDIELSQGEIDDIATRECDCEDARRARELSNSVLAVSESIRRNASMFREVKEAITACLEPVAEGYIQNITMRVDDLTTVKISLKKGRLTCVRTVKEDTVIDEIGEH